jgi:hypothetical protein
MAEDLLGSKAPSVDTSLTTEELLKSTSEKPKEEKKSPEQLMVEALVDYPFLKFENGVLQCGHKELKQYLKPLIIKMGGIVQRGKILANLNGGVTNIDPQTQSLNSCIATVLVGYEEKLATDLLAVEDTDLIMGLYVAAVSFNSFFRTTPLGFVL